MKLEDTVFDKKQFDFKALSEYGFRREEGIYRFEGKIMDGDLSFEVSIYSDGAVKGVVADSMTGEVYEQLRIVSATGSYVGRAREEYEEVLRDIADRCCTDLPFSSAQGNRISGLILSEYSVRPDFPWKTGSARDAGVFRHADNHKWFALIMNVYAEKVDANEQQEKKDVLNLKADESEIETLVEQDGIFPAYHMNHKKWISVILDDRLSDARVMELIQKSFDLTKKDSLLIDEGLIRKVLDIADNIPPGRVASYGRIAEMAGRPKNSRLVGKIMSMADRFGEHPCHRVVNHAGRLVPGWKEQRGMLEKEGVEFKKNGCVDMSRFSI